MDEFDKTYEKLIQDYNTFTKNKTATKNINNEEVADFVDDVALMYREQLNKMNKIKKLHKKALNFKYKICDHEWKRQSTGYHNERYIECQKCGCEK